MIISKLIGGIGNQMFQYAVGRRLAHVLGVDLKLDVSRFETQDVRSYSLGSFNIRKNFATPEELSVLRVPKRGLVEHLLDWVLGRAPKSAPTYIMEKDFHFDSDILDLPDGVYLDGYWQSEKYFADIEGIIRQEFTVKTPQVDKDNELSEQMASCASVSLHIRRGDYVSDLQTSKVHGTCGLAYYARAIAEIYSRVDKPYLFVFSDDPEWSKVNIDISHPVIFVDHNNALKGYEDLRLMSQCHHHIIANSSFSWWGAWLNPNSDKIVIAPDRWFNKEDIDTTDLLPESWISL